LRTTLTMLSRTFGSRVPWSPPHDPRRLVPRAECDMLAAPALMCQRRPARFEIPSHPPPRRPTAFAASATLFTRSCRRPRHSVPNFRLEPDGQGDHRASKDRGGERRLRSGRSTQHSPGPLKARTTQCARRGTSRPGSACANARRAGRCSLVGLQTVLGRSRSRSPGHSSKAVTKRNSNSSACSYSTSRTRWVEEAPRRGGISLSKDHPYHASHAPGAEAIGLSFEGATTVDKGPVSSVVEMTFPPSRAGLVVWTIDDPNDEVEYGRSANGLKPDGLRLVDLGASTTVSAQLSGTRVPSGLTAGTRRNCQRWTTPWGGHHAVNQGLSLLVQSRRTPPPPRVGNSQDRYRCTAFSVR